MCGEISTCSHDASGISGLTVPSAGAILAVKIFPTDASRQVTRLTPTIRNCEKGVLVLNQDANTVRMIYDLYLEGCSIGYLAKTLGLKYENLAIQILKCRSNSGYIQYNGEEYLGQHDPLISVET